MACTMLCTLQTLQKLSTMWQTDACKRSLFGHILSSVEFSFVFYIFLYIKSKAILNEYKLHRNILFAPRYFLALPPPLCLTHIPLAFEIKLRKVQQQKKSERRTQLKCMKWLECTMIFMKADGNILYEYMSLLNMEKY